MVQLTREKVRGIAAALALFSILASASDLFAASPQHTGCLTPPLMIA